MSLPWLDLLLEAPLDERCRAVLRLAAPGSDELLADRRAVLRLTSPRWKAVRPPCGAVGLLASIFGRLALPLPLSLPLPWPLPLPLPLPLPSVGGDLVGALPGLETLLAALTGRRATVGGRPTRPSTHPVQPNWKLLVLPVI